MSFIKFLKEGNLKGLSEAGNESKYKEGEFGYWWTVTPKIKKILRVQII